VVVGIFLIVGLAVAGARGDEPPKSPTPGAKPAPGGTADEPKKDGPQVKTITLNHADPDDVRQVLGLLGYPASMTGTAPQPAPAGTPGNGAKPRVVVDGRTRTVFVRGADKDIEAISDVLAMLDAEPGKPVPEVKNLHLIPLRHAKVDEGLQLLTGLDLANGVVPLRKTNALLVTQAGNFKAVQEVISALDVEAKAKPKTSSGAGEP
jgi:hypothetical protein